jgi:hypothetical protein
LRLGKFSKEKNNEYRTTNALPAPSFGQSLCISAYFTKYRIATSSKRMILAHAVVICRMTALWVVGVLLARMTLRS